MADQFKNVMIGIFVVAAGAIVIFILMFLHPRVGDESKRLRVRFTNIDKVSIGTRVTYGGKPVGEVVGIREVEFGRGGKMDADRHIYLYELELRVDSGVNVFNTDEVALRTSGLLGERNIEISPIAPEPGQELINVDKDVIYAQQVNTVEDTLKDLRQVGDKMMTLLDGLADVIHTVKKEKIVENAGDSIRHVKNITGSLDNPKNWSETLANIHRFSERLNTSWDKVETSIIDFNVTSANMSKVSNQIIQGEGTFGKVLVRDDLYLQTSALFNKAETILDDINHYGLLFQTDKGWQRLRARRLNLLQKLCCPQEFRNYFNDEIDQISTSLSRVSMVLDKTIYSPCGCFNLMEDPEYTKVYAELLRRVATIREELQMYNIQAVDEEVRKTELDYNCLCE